MPVERTPGDSPGSRAGDGPSKGSRWVPPVLWAAVILVGTSWPSISVGPDDIFGIDKLVHFTMYGVLAFLVMRGSHAPSSGSRIALVVFGLCAFGAADEWHQGFINGRSSSGLDWIADALGVITGTTLARFHRPAAPSPAVHRSSTT